MYVKNVLKCADELISSYLTTGSIKLYVVYFVDL